jgi:hypothetical protein
MISLPLFPIWFFQALGTVAVIVFTLLSLRITRRLTARDPENALWLFLDWLTMGFVIFSLSHGISHTLQAIIDNYGESQTLWRLRRIFGGFDSIIYVIIAAITLFFHRVQRLYRRMEADHHHLEETRSPGDGAHHGGNGSGHGPRYPQSPPRHRRLQQSPPQEDRPG